MPDKTTNNVLRHNNNYMYIRVLCEFGVENRCKSKQWLWKNNFAITDFFYRSGINPNTKFYLFVVILENFDCAIMCALYFSLGIVASCVFLLSDLSPYLTITNWGKQRDHGWQQTMFSFVILSVVWCCSYGFLTDGLNSLLINPVGTQNPLLSM